MAIALSCTAISLIFSCSVRATWTSRSASTVRVRTALSRSMPASRTCRSARIRLCSASRLRSASMLAILAFCSAVRMRTSCSCARVMKVSCWVISSLRCSASRFFSRTAISVSCSISLRSLRRRSVSCVSFTRPSASKAFFSLKCSLSVWFRLVSETLSSSRPFLVRSSATVFCTPWTNFSRWSCSSCMVMVAAVDRNASTNLSSVSSDSSEMLLVR